jgi:spore coat protein U-like protein
MKRLWIVVLSGAFCLFPRLAGAGASCSFSSVVGIQFGAVDTTSLTAVDSVGDFTVSCNGQRRGPMFTIDLSTGGSASYSMRRMAGPGGAGLGYNLYVDPLRQVIWGDGTGGTSHYGPTVFPLSDLTLQVYGRIPPHQNSASGAYSDSVTITVNF